LGHNLEKTGFYFKEKSISYRFLNQPIILSSCIFHFPLVFLSLNFSLEVEVSTGFC